MEVDNNLYDVLADICKPRIYTNPPAALFTAAQVRMLCIDAIMYYREHEGEDKIDINKFFELKGL